MNGKAYGQSCWRHAGAMMVTAEEDGHEEFRIEKKGKASITAAIMR